MTEFSLNNNKTPASGDDPTNYPTFQHTFGWKIPKRPVSAYALGDSTCGVIAEVLPDLVNPMVKEMIALGHLTLWMVFLLI